MRMGRGVREDIIKRLVGGHEWEGVCEWLENAPAKKARKAYVDRIWYDWDPG
jgi:hypothetical protein